MSNKLLRNKMRIQFLLILGLLVVQVPAHAQSYCVSGLYSSGCVFNDGIESFSFGSISNIGFNCNSASYHDYTNSHQTVLDAGQTYAFTITHPSPWSQITGVWIDFDQNGSFNDTSDFFWASSTYALTNTDSITIPATAPSGGPYRMRVRTRWLPSSSFSQSESCTQYSFGETHDYTVYISGKRPGMWNVTYNNTNNQVIDFAPAYNSPALHKIWRSIGDSPFVAIDSSFQSIGNNRFRYVDSALPNEQICYFISYSHLNSTIFYSDTFCLYNLTAVPGQQVTHLMWDLFEGYPIDSVKVLKQNNGTWDTIATLPGTDTAFTHPSCQTSTYRVLGRESNGDRETVSDSVTIVPFDTIPPSPPVSLSASVLSGNTISFDFTQVADSDVNRYVIFSSSNGGGYAAIDTVFAPTSTPVVFIHSGINTLQNTYSYYVSALDSCGENLSAASGQQQVVQLKGQEMNYANKLLWSKYEGFPVQQYEVQRLENGTWTTVSTQSTTDTTHTDTLLPCNIPYYYRIKTSEAGGSRTSFSDTIALTPFDTIAPASPQIKYADVQPNSQIHVEWQSSSSADVNGYIIYRKSGTSPFQPIDTVFYDSAYTDTSPNARLESYCYAISALDSCAGLESNLSTTHCTILLSADTNGCEQHISLNWSPYIGWTGVSQYYIWRSVNGQPEVLLDSVNGIYTHYIDSAVNYYSQYGYRIEARQSGGSYTSSSNDSSQKVFQPAIPQLVSVSKVTTSTIAGEVEVKWQPVSQAQHLSQWRLYYSPDGSSFTILEDSIFLSRLSFTHSGINSEMDDHWYYLVGVDSCGNESDSSGIYKTMDLNFSIGQLVHQLSWTPYEGFPVQQYLLELWSGNQFMIWDTIPGGDTSYTRSPAPCNYDITYRIRAEDSFGNYSYSDTATNRAIDSIPADPPVLLNAQVLDGQRAQLTFQGSDSLDMYQYDIQRAIDGQPFMSVGQVSFTNPGDTVSYVDSTFTLTSRLCYFVVAIDSCLNASASDTFCLIQLAGQEENLSNSLLWQHFQGYLIQEYVVQTWLNGAWEDVDTVAANDTTYTHQPLPCNEERYYRIRGQMQNGPRVTTSDSIALTPFDTIPPDSPELYRAYVSGPAAITIEFDTTSATDVKFFEISTSVNGSSFMVLDTVFNSHFHPTNYTHSGINPQQNRYCYFVRAIDTCAENTSVPSAIHCVSELQGTAGNLQNSLQWKPYIGFNAVEYTVQRRQGSGWVNLSTTKDTFYNDSGLACNVPYHYRILPAEQSALSTLDSSLSDTIVLTPFDTIPPDAPVLKTASIELNQQVRLEWFPSASPDAKEYEVWRSTGMGSFSKVGTVTYDSVYVDQNVNPQQESYRYYVIAIDSCNTTNRSTPSDTDVTMNVQASTIACVPLVNLQWNPYQELLQEVNQYQIWRQDTSGFSAEYTLPASSTAFIDSNVSEGQSYCYRIQAIDTNGGFSAFSDTVCISPWVYPIPDTARIVRTSITRTDVATGSVLVEWERADPADTFARGYYLYHGTFSAAGPFSLVQDITDLNTTSYTHTGLDTRTSAHFYKVVVYNLCVEEGAHDTVHQPINLTVENRNLEAELSWTPYGGFPIQQYELRRSIDGQPVQTVAVIDPADSAFIDSALRCDHAYAWQLIGHNYSYNWKSTSDSVWATAFDTIPPTQADLLFGTVTATDVAAGAVELQFTPATEENRKGYFLYRSENGGSYSLHDSVLNTSTSTITFTDPNINTQNNHYSYYFTSIDSCGNESEPLDTHTVMNLHVQPQSQVNVLSWNEYEGFGQWQYRVDRRTPATSWKYQATLPSGTTGYRDSSIQCDTFYRYRILATETNTGYTSLSNTDTAKGLELEPPLAPVIHRATVTQTGTTSGTVRLEWNASASPDVERYHLERSVDGVNWSAVATNVAGLDYTDGGLNTQGQPYHYRISAEDSCGNVSVGYSPPHTTMHLQAQAGNEEVVLQWTRYQGWLVRHYRLWRDGVLVDSVPGTQVNYADSPLLCTQEYSFIVEAVADSSLFISARSNEASAQPYDTKPPAAPELVTATVTDPNQEIELVWRRPENHDVSGYQLFQSGNNTTPIFTTQDPEEITHQISVTGKAGPLCYVVQAQDFCENTSTKSNQGCIIFPEVQALKQENLLTWEPYQEWPGGISRYEIYRSPDTATWSLVATLPAGKTRYLDTELDPAFTQFIYQVIAYGNSGSQAAQSASMAVGAVQAPVVWVPNSFSPDRTFGLNDAFGPEGAWIESYEMRIYNRWGEMVYQTPNGQRWDGRINGQMAPAGVYSYRVTAFGFGDEQVRVQGTVTILR